MNLMSISFIGIYFPLLLICYYNPFFKNNTFRKILLLTASLGMYSFGEPIYLFLLIGVILLNYGLVKLSDKFQTKILRTVAIILDALLLLFFKYINSLLDFAVFNPEISRIAFPIGLSYFIFKAISFVVDSSEETGGNILDVSIYISNFLTIISGPLSTYKQELPEITTKKKTNISTAYNGFLRIMTGLSKKIIIADSLSVIANRCFITTDLSVLMAWAGAVAYTLQIYFDFSGYTDFVIGLGNLFGFNLPENFNYPYMANSISDFWKRWHISLTKWVTKYIYIPLGGSRVKTVFRHIFNLFVVWFVTGMWHGSTITFIVWGMIYFVLQAIEKYTKISSFLNKIHMGHIYTLFFVIITWVIFKSESLPFAYNYIKAMFSFGGTFCTKLDISELSHYTLILVLGIIFSTDVGCKIKNLASNNKTIEFIYNSVIIVLFVISAILLLGKGMTAPLYAKF